MARSATGRARQRESILSDFRLRKSNSGGGWPRILPTAYESVAAAASTNVFIASASEISAAKAVRAKAAPASAAEIRRQRQRQPKLAYIPTKNGNFRGS